MDKKWHLNPKEVTWYGGSSSRPGRTTARQPRSMDERELTLNLVHTPTKIEVDGQVPPGSYSRSSMSQKRDLLYKQLFSELENKVAKHLKIPGR